MGMTPPLEIQPLRIPEDEAQRRFEALQKKLVPLWKHICRFNDREQTIVVVPSQTIEFDCKGAEMQAYEERMLFMLLPSSLDLGVFLGTLNALIQLAKWWAALGSNQ